MSQKLVEWILRISVAGEFIGHGVFALQGKSTWIEWIQKLLGVNPESASQILFLIGALDITLAILVLIKPLPIALLWMAIWGFWTALIRPVVGEPVWDFVERWANWGAPLALLFIIGWPRRWQEWFK
jgi:uncharacterized membrane protein YphA (DoxX/SURF4 family)